MDFERALETQRLRLLRLVAGLLAAVVFVSVGPFSNVVSRWVGAGIASILSRAELAARYLVIVQARVLATRLGSNVDPAQLREVGLRDHAGVEGAASLSDLGQRLKILRALLENLPRHGLRLLRRTEKSVRRFLRADPSPCLALSEFRALGAWRLARVRVERPPDKDDPRSRFENTSPRLRAGGEGD